MAQRIGLLENRLDGVMVNFNATLSNNSAVRKEVDHLVQERAGFNDMIARLQKKGFELKEPFSSNPNQRPQSRTLIDN